MSTSYTSIITQEHKFVVECLRIQFSMAKTIADHIQDRVYIFDKTGMFNNNPEIKIYNNIRYFYNPSLNTYGVLSATAQKVFQPFEQEPYMAYVKEANFKAVILKDGIALNYVSDN